MPAEKFVHDGIKWNGGRLYRCAPVHSMQAVSEIKRNERFPSASRMQFLEWVMATSRIESIRVTMVEARSKR
ncbi:MULTISPECIES: hypothetical protein [unclassified Sinorhizobium]|jgi:hypothetical protein|uniref:Uncharacterized protein n=1 Tax=Rhizobium meliloti TaxID=382 RepID=A0A2J0Z931_RHIML|nr:MULTISPECIES: hypothetical protein [unclassified Sinorhizobium]PJR17029.1 hypothetical protein CEJ86_02235 [Sinorhizobium meliloti]GCA48453.1 hypothetical protein KGO5_00882 [Sinorhizobium sp. KGO-5]WEJ10547.1 hypothetical protein N0Q90_04960 [Sinorhizobium sp. M103]WEJ14886.1 hypothetical protein N0Q91_15370 [Sinorhizobium sp. K101]WEJ37517.1 hypothetical protein N0R80_04930 [Sinorhizobium sp. C101]